MSRPAKVVINLSALRHNFSRIRTIAPDSRVMAIVKADAYGHGLVRIAQSLEQADAFGVACLEEARELRQAKIQQRIILLEGPYSGEELTKISQLGLDMVVHDLSQVEMLEQNQLNKPVCIWLKLDTGMHRLGFSPDLASEALARLEQSAGVKEIRLMTHLASANNREDPMTRKQLQCFSQFNENMSLEKTIANSAGILAFPDAHVDWVRPGIMLYGVSPFSDSNGSQEGLKPVMTLQSKLITVRALKAGDPVGYGATWRCPEDMSVGVVAAGYGDGYPRHAESGTPVLVNGKRVELIGRASMDMLTVDLRSQSQAKTGDPVVLWGEGLPVEEVANHAGTIPYEVLCAVHKRLKFEYGEA
ncbi:MAG: alanine racemase [Proteobacteria bacterium]|nr:alanine racemase [Pseudomonadota bacterium]